LLDNKLLACLPLWVSEGIKQIKGIREIRLKPFGNVLIFTDKPMVIRRDRVLSKQEFILIFERICQSSVYSLQREISSGYVTLSGGHRAGVCGVAIYDCDKISTLTDISHICIRVSREIKGSAEMLLPHILSGRRIYNTLIISPPGCGKTTILRDVARVLGGEGNFFRVGIADERGEIAPMRHGVPVYDTGIASFVMSRCKKKNAMEMMLRSMGPDVIITDEIGNRGDEDALFKTINCGVKIICTCHGWGVVDIMRREVLKTLIEKSVFERVIVLTDNPVPGTLKEIIGEKICI